jgi:hypothetical protein
MPTGGGYFWGLGGEELVQATPSPPVGWAPPIAMPPKEALSYWREAITLALLLLALPWLVLKLITDPERVLAGAARKHAGA